MLQDLVLLQHMILQPWNLRNLAVFPEQMLPVMLVQAVSILYQIIMSRSRGNIDSRWWPVANACVVVLFNSVLCKYKNINQYFLCLALWKIRYTIICQCNIKSKTCWSQDEWVREERKEAEPSALINSWWSTLLNFWDCKSLQIFSFRHGNKWCWI